MFVVSCAPPMTDEELEAELAKLTPEEREQLLADLESKESGALAGQAVNYAIKTKVSPRVAYAPVSQLRKTIAKIKTGCTPKTNAELCFLDQTCGDIPDGCGGVVQCGNLCGDFKKPHCQNNECVSGEEVTAEKTDYVQPPLPGCSDTDGGMFPLKKGNVEGSADTCLEENKLREYFCKDELPTFDIISCNECINGQCIITEKCTDTDGGSSDYFTRGTVEGSADASAQFYLNNPTEELLVENKYAYDNGLIELLSPIGWKSHFTDFCFTWVGDSGAVASSHCTVDTATLCQVKEFSCNSNDKIDIKWADCEYGCSNGACLPAPN